MDPELDARHPAAMSKAEGRPDVGHAGLVFAGWLLCASLASALARAVQAGSALQVFDGAHYMSSIVAIESFRASGAQVAVEGAALGVFAGVHGHQQPVDGRSASRLALLFFALTPGAAVLAAILMAACGAAVFVQFYSGTYTVVAAELEQRLWIDDVVLGMGRGVAFACLVGIGSRWAFPAVARQRWRTIWKYVAVIAMVRGATMVVGPVLDLFVVALGAGA